MAACLSERTQFETEAKIGRWVVDFLLPGRIVIETDGTYWHSRPGAKERDQRKVTALVSHGMTVLRISEVVMSDGPRLRQFVESACRLSESRRST